ncbi:MAG TPA: RyR domain-containing protein [bacterium]|nr:RyR domain-containing protein [bacterium]
MPPPTRNELPADLIERLAEELHACYLERRIDEGQNAVENASLKPWERLPGYLQESNREAVREFAKRLVAIGFVLAPDWVPGAPVTTTDLEPYMGLLAQLGHVQWCNERHAMGWLYAPGPKDVANRTHPCLVPWHELPFAEQMKDRQQVEDLLELVAKARWRVLRLEGTPADPGAYPEVLSAYMFPDAPPIIPPKDPEPEPVAELPVQPDLPSEEVDADTERLARALHNAYVAHRMQEGETLAKNPALRPWESLAEQLKRSNRQAVDHLRGQLETLGYRIMAKDAMGPDDVAVGPQDFARHVEVLAQMAHVRWYNERTALGWMPGDVKDVGRRTHPFLKPWEKLPESEREKSREQVRDIPKVLAAAGLRVVRSKPRVPKVGARAATPEKEKRGGFFGSLFPVRD